MALLVVGGFLYWVLGTTPGGRWALVTATMQMGGSVSGVSGSVWQGLQIGHIVVPAGPVTVEATDFDLRIQWAALLERQLHIENISAASLDVAREPTDEPDTESGPFVMPELPVQVRVDRLALGDFSMTINDGPLPVDVGNLLASLYLGDGQGQLRLNSLDLGHELADMQLAADFHVLELIEPWPFDAMVQASIQGRGGSDSLLCAQRYVPTLPRDVTNKSCTLDLHLALKGNMDDMVLDTGVTGQGMSLDAMLNLTPTGAFPLRDARIDLTLADDSSLQAQLDWVSHGASSQTGADHDQVSGTLQVSRLNLGQLVGPALPDAILTTSGRFDALLENRNRLLSSNIELDVAEGSVWNGEPLQGQVTASVDTAGPAETDADNAQAMQPDGLDWRTIQVDDLVIDVHLGQNHVEAAGGFGAPDSELALSVSAPDLASFWPGLPGGVELDAQLRGAVRNHALKLDTVYTPDDSAPETVGLAPAQVSLDIEGGWQAVGPATADVGALMLEGWEGRVHALEASHAGLGLLVAGSPLLRVVPGSTAADGLWRVGSAQLDLSLDGRPILQLVHGASSGGSGGQWATSGQVERIVISPGLVNDIQNIVSRMPGTSAQEEKQEQRGGVKIRGASNDVTEIELALDWDLSFEQALAGTLNVRHLSGDVMVPAEPPFALGLETLSLDVTARPAGNAVSRLGAELNVVTADMGRAQATMTAQLHATPGGGFALEPVGTIIEVDASIDDLGWVSLFTGDAMEFGGHVEANVTLTSLADGRWDSDGTVTGTGIRIVRIDDGVRLLDGTLSARLENERVILEKLEFPARLRVEPKEWRTAEWVSTNPDARDGYLRLSGDWHLNDMIGDVDIELHRYPVLQRSDRYAMVSGNVHVNAVLPALSITGRVEADAGWIDLDMLGGIPTVDGDVVIIRAGDEPAEVNVPMDLSMDIEVDLGPRVYLTGYGVNSGLVGNMRVMMIDNRLTAVGALRTRGGAIETYGQRLQLRRGTITFQGDITSPILNIEALRTGQAVEAGVRVSGTARRPAIDLVSYPDVSDIEKLSWLLFGHGPDESGGDMALLLTVGTSFLGDGEPFYRKFGIDELSLQSGDIGSAGSILPAESVVSGLNTGASDLENQFISASKGVAAGFTLSVRQALSDAGTVGRVSYRLARGLTAELSVGTVNGLALIYRWFSRN